jgi:hypothetical protein
MSGAGEPRSGELFLQNRRPAGRTQGHPIRVGAAGTPCLGYLNYPAGHRMFPLRQRSSNNGVTQAVLWLVVYVGIRGVRDVQPQLAKSEAQGLAGDPQHAGGLVLTAVRVLQNAGEQDSVQLAVRMRIQVVRAGP